MDTIRKLDFFDPKDLEMLDESTMNPYWQAYGYRGFTLLMRLVMLTKKYSIRDNKIYDIIKEYIIEHPEEVNKLGYFGDTPFSVATENIHNRSTIKIVKILLDHGAIIQEGTLIAHLSSSAKHDIELANLLIEYNADVNGRAWYDSNTPLITAVKYSRNIEAIKLLLKHGANIYVEDYNGHYALGTPYRYIGDKNIIKLLFEYDASFIESSYSKDVNNSIAELNIKN